MGIDSDNHSQKYVVGIDFGSAGIGYAFGYINNKKDITPVLSNLKGQCDNKVPNEIILDNNLNFLEFGNGCSSYINSNRDNKDNYLYFKDIKMNLYKNQKDYFIKSTNGKEVKIEIIVTEILKKISDEAIKHINTSQSIKVDKNQVKWVVTIPAIWEEKSKQIMINASRNAGLINDNTDLSLFLALEPEAAGIFYFSDLNNQISSQERKKELNKPFIICDIGAGTVDICTLKKEIDKDKLIEEYPPIGGDYGGNVINKEFIKILIVELFGKEKVEKIQNDGDERYKEFEEKIEKLKRDLTKKEYNSRLDCKIFKDKDNSKTLDNYISEIKNKEIIKKYKIKNDEWELIFSSQVLLDITKDIANKIYLKLEEVYNNVKNAQIIFTGAGSNNEILIYFIQEYFKKKKNVFMDIKTTIQPQVSILKGAVIFGCQKDIIRKRKPKYTIGINISRNWDEKEHKNGGKKYLNEKENKWKCGNLFKKFITINEYIDFDKTISHTFVALGSKPEIVFYKTLKKDCKFTDEKENGKLIIEEFGSVKFDIEDFDPKHREVRIDMKMGGTYIMATAVYLKTNKNIKITQNFEDIKDSVIIKSNS